MRTGASLHNGEVYLGWRVTVHIVTLLAPGKEAITTPYIQRGISAERSVQIMTLLHLDLCNVDKIQFFSQSKRSDSLLAEANL